MKVKFPIQRRAEYKIYFQWREGCHLRGFDLRGVRFHSVITGQVMT